MSLLQKALNIAPQRKNNNENVDDELLELAMAYSRHEVTQGQVAKVLGTALNSVHPKMRAALASGVRAGKLVLKK